MHTSLLVFAAVNGLPLKTPELDYSTAWEPAAEYLLARIVRDWPATVPEVSPEPVNADISGLDFKRLHMSGPFEI